MGRGVTNYRNFLFQLKMEGRRFGLRVTHIGWGQSFLWSGLDMDQALEVVGQHPTVCRVDSQQLDQVESRVA